MKEIKNVVSFVAIAFLLLGVLFGMNIMGFIFANISNANIDSIDDVSVTINNESSAFINATGYTVGAASNTTFLGGVSVDTIYNATDGVIITSGNYSVNAASGVITNATVTNWADVNVTYSYNEKSGVRVAVEETNNGSLQAVVTYTNQSDTQMSTVAIAITLIILIVLFLIFWKGFIRPMMKGTNKSKKGDVFG